ncbi:hypothetical protein LCGC14_3108720 [marine sediment metagenome]|uniref:Uncharacterized protein n=1 Tax=marine sediment metagenome TaxID=412755 RepID=A0A0F8YVL8_9ZZZZ
MSDVRELRCKFCNGLLMKGHFEDAYFEVACRKRRGGMKCTYNSTFMFKNGKEIHEPRPFKEFVEVTARI